MASMTAAQTRHCLTHLPINIAVLIAGHQGLGKSETVAQVAREAGIDFIDLRLSQNDTGDVKGMPFLVNGRTYFAPPEWFPVDKDSAKELQGLLGLTDAIAAGRFGDRGILFLDELNRAPREVQQAGFELVLDRRINMRALPAGWRVVAAINDDADIYTVNDMDPALVSRFFHINFNPTVDEWLEWASTDNRVHDSVVQFIRKFPDMLDPTPELLKEASVKGVEKVHDRRGWTRFAQTIDKLTADHDAGDLPLPPLEKSNENLDMLRLIGAGFLGNLASIKYVSFIETDYQSLDADVILNKWTRAIEDRVKGIVDKGAIPELGSYNEDIMLYIDKKLSGNFNKKQSDNLYKYLSLLPKEVVADFWMSASRGKTAQVVDAWYQSDKKYKEVVKLAIVNKTKK